ncbi:MAG: multiple sugar transport system ATP-binding protein, partial [Gaiellales bacterium]|nr:multiple sugar transport system ATP-binding protein [Gaiellales bacterium]
MAQISFDRVYKLFGDVVAVDDLSLDIQDGEFLVLVGPSGCGKTTSLRMLAGFERATYGTVSIGGVVQNTVAPQNRDLAMVFQSYALYPHMTVYKNLAFGMKVRREPRAEVRPRVEEVARLLDIETLLDRRPSELSGGQRQRVALGRALLRSPRAFLMDEPLSNLDAALRVQMRVELKHLHDRLGVTTVYVTHDQVEAMTMGDRIAIMNAGRLQQADTPEAIYVRPANLFVAGFIGSPKMNLVRGRVSSQDGRVAAEFLGQTVVLAGALADAVAKVEHGEIVVGLRAEDLRLVDDAPASYSTRLTGVVDVWEPLGSETYVVLKVGDSTLT